MDQINRVLTFFFFLKSSMERILERYDRYLYSDKQLVGRDVSQSVSFRYVSFSYLMLYFCCSN